MDTIKQPKRFLILLILAAMVLGYFLGTVTPPGTAQAVVSRLSISAAITPQQWAAVQASNALLLGDQTYSVYLPLSVRD